MQCNFSPPATPSTPLNGVPWCTGVGQYIVGTVAMNDLGL